MTIEHDHAEFTRQAAALVAANDRVPVQRVGDVPTPTAEITDGELHQALEPG